MNMLSAWFVRSLTLVAAMVTLGVTAEVVDAAEAPTVRILFVGSSSTYWNDLPGEVAKAISGKIAEREGAPVEAEIVGRSGSDIRVYSSPRFDDYQYGVKKGQTFLEKVRDEKFDFVVLMTVCNFILQGEPPEGGMNHAEAISSYVDAVRESGAEPVIYEMGWGKTEREEEGRKRIFELAVAKEIRFYAPCSSAWARVYAERPDLKLQHPNDASHPGDLGHFLNLACFYAALTRRSPEGQLPRDFHVWPHLSKAEREAKQAELDAANARFVPDAYQARLPEWMRRNAGAGVRGRVDDETARFLERTAYETWRDADARLRAAATE